jgi:hypothetical protein
MKVDGMLRSFLRNYRPCLRREVANPCTTNQNAAKGVVDYPAVRFDRQSPPDAAQCQSDIHSLMECDK